MEKKTFQIQCYIVTTMHYTKNKIQFIDEYKNALDNFRQKKLDWQSVAYPHKKINRV